MSVLDLEEKQNITLSLSKGTIQKAKVLAAKKSTSVSGLLAEELSRLVGEDDSYEQSKRRALALLDQGFHLGGVHNWDRDSLHDRAALREE